MQPSIAGRLRGIFNSVVQRTLIKAHEILTRRYVEFQKRPFTESDDGTGHNAYRARDLLHRPAQQKAGADFHLAQA